LNLTKRIAHRRVVYVGAALSVLTAASCSLINGLHQDFTEVDCFPGGVCADAGSDAAFDGPSLGDGDARPTPIDAESGSPFSDGPLEAVTTTDDVTTDDSEADAPTRTDAASVDASDGSDAVTDATAEAHDASCESATGRCPPVLLASGAAVAIAVDSNTVYWGSDGIFGCAIDGCNKHPTTIFPPTGYQVYGVATDGTNVYWVTPGAIASYVATCPTSGCPVGSDGGANPTLLATSQGNPVDIAVHSQTVYWLDATGATVLDCSVNGCGGHPSRISMGPCCGGAALAINGDAAVWISLSNINTVSTCPLAGCPMGDDGGLSSTPLWSGMTPTPTAIAADATNAYWTTNDGAVVKCALTGCSGKPTTLASGQALGSAHGIAVDGTTVYWTNSSTGTVAACSTNGCNETPTVLATEQPGAGAIAVDSTSLYFGTSAGVMRLGK
jgi:hypothetical protein